MVNIESLLTKRIMLLFHERGKEMSVEEVHERAAGLADYLYTRGVPSERINALELMLELMEKWT